MSPLLISCAVLAATLLTSFISGLFGMAGGIILMGVLVWLLPVGAAMVLHGFIQLISNGWRAWLWRKHMRADIVLQSLLGSIGALVIFSLVSFVPEKRLVLLFLGSLPFLQYVMPKNLRLDITKTGQAFACGLLTTSIQLVAGVSGALLDQFYAYTTLDRRTQVATKAACQCIGHISKLIYFGGLMAAGAELAQLPYWLFPALILTAMAGTTLAAKPLEKISNEQFRNWTRIILLIVGSFYLFQAARLYLVG